MVASRANAGANRDRAEAGRLRAIREAALLSPGAKGDVTVNTDGTYEVPGLGGSSLFTLTTGEAEIDFGSVPCMSASTTVTDANVYTTSAIVITQSGNAATGGTVDDAEWDAIVYAATPGTGSMTVRAIAHPGPVTGKRRFSYFVYNG